MTQLCLLLLAAAVLVSTPSRLLLLLLLGAVVAVVVGRTDDLLTMESVHLDFPYFNRFMFSNISRSMDSSRNEKQESCCWDDEECDNLFTASALYQQCTISGSAGSTKCMYLAAAVQSSGRAARVSTDTSTPGLELFLT